VRKTPSPQARRQPARLRLRVWFDLKALDGTLLKASYFGRAKPGPVRSCCTSFNRTRKAWDDLAGQAGGGWNNTLTLDMRGFGESGGTPNTKLTDVERPKYARSGPATLTPLFKLGFAARASSGCHRRGRGGELGWPIRRSSAKHSC